MKTEEQLLDLIKSQEKIIDQLKEQLKELNDFVTAVKSKTLKNEGTQTNVYVKNMSTSTEIPIEINSGGTMPIKKVNAETQTVAYNNYDMPFNVRQLDIKNQGNLNVMHNNNNRYKKIVILTDDYGRHIDKIVNRKIDNNIYKVQVIIKPGATFNQIIENLESLTKSYTSNDHVIIIGGYNNFNNKRRYPLFKDLGKKAMNCSNTNLTISTAPLKHSKVNKFIHKYNKKLSEFLFLLEN